jgi:hypothetical protein
MRFHYKVVETRTTYHLKGSIVDDQGATRQYERSFRTSDRPPGDAYAAERTFITGLAVAASPGNINYLTLLGGELSELSGGFVDQHAFGDERLGLETSAVELHVSCHGAVPDWPRYRTALIGIGLRAGDGANVSKLAVRTVEEPVTDSALDLFEWAHRWHPDLGAPTDYEKLTTLPEGWLCNGFLMSAASGDLSRCRADWGRFVPGMEVQIVGSLAGPGAEGSFLVSGESIGPGAPPATWRIDPKHSGAAELDGRLRHALERMGRVRVSGILWEGERTAELAAIGPA